MRAAELAVVVRAHWILVAATTVAVAVLAMLPIWLGPATYRSESIVRVSVSGPDANLRFAYSHGGLYRGSLTAYSPYASLFTGPIIRDQVALQLQRSAASSTPWWAASSDVVVHDQDVTVTVAGESSDPARAGQVSGLAATAFAQEAGAGASRVPEPRRPDLAVAVLGPPTAPRPTTGPADASRLAAGLIGGLALGVGAALLAERSRAVRPRSRATAHPSLTS